MPPSDTFVRSTRPGSRAAAKFSDDDGDGDRDGMYVFVTARGKCWRLDYCRHGKRKTHSLGTYPEVSLSKERTRALDAWTLLADGRAPRDEKHKTR